MENEDDLILSYGLDGDASATGDSLEYLLPPLPAEWIANLARGQKIDPAALAELVANNRNREAHLGLRTSFDVKDLSVTGWGVIFHEHADPAVYEALKPLLEHRRAAAAARNEKLYREYIGPRGFQPNERFENFLSRNGRSSFGTVDPEQMPYYLMIVGGPVEIPYEFQHSLDVSFAVGRIYFDNVADYARYANSVVAAETGKLPHRNRRTAFFGVMNPDDPATKKSALSLTRPLSETIEAAHADWKVSADIGDPATRERLEALMGCRGEPAPDFLFAACHGMAYTQQAEMQRRYAGALVCQDWPGPKRPYHGPKRSLFFAGEDLTPDARIFGMIAMFFSCYGAGTPQFDQFYKYDREKKEWLWDAKQGKEISTCPIVSELPKRMLAHPNGGALAVIGHVDRTWTSSFLAPGDKVVELETFRSVISELLDGYPVGHALSHFNQRYSEIALRLSTEVQELADDEFRTPDHEWLAQHWCARNDARNFIVVGDPAVRLG